MQFDEVLPKGLVFVVEALDELAVGDRTIDLLPIVLDFF